MPPRYRVILTDEARAHLDEIVGFIQRESPERAKTTFDALVEATKSLATMPHRFKQVLRSRKRASAVRSLVLIPYIIYYKVREDIMTVDVVGIRHGRRRRTRRFP